MDDTKRAARYEAALFAIMAVASERTAMGVWQCHEIYTMTRDAIQGRPVPSSAREVDGVVVSASVLALSQEGRWIDAIRELRADQGLTLQAAKAVVDRLRGTP
jgi:ribosomal protein L7/L12